MGGYDHILSKYDPLFMFVVGEKWKIRLFRTVISAKNLEMPNSPTRNAGSLLCIAWQLNMLSRCLSNSNSTVNVLKRSHVLLWWYWIGFLFVSIKACSNNATYIIRFIFLMYYPEIKKWFMNQWIWKELCTAKTKLFQPLVYHQLYRFCKRWPNLW